MGLAGGEALVEQVVGEGGVGGEEGLGEEFGFGGLGAGGAVGVEGKADDEGGDLVAADEAADGFEVCREPGAVEGEERLRGEAETVGDGQTDAAVPYVEGESTAGGHGWLVVGG